VRHAPPVSVLCQGRGWRAAQTAVFAISAGALALWGAQHLWEPAGATLWMAALALVVTATLAWRALAVPALELRWDGQAWYAGDDAIDLNLMLLSSRIALLRLRTATRCTWLAVGAAEAGPAWHALRVALLARPQPAGAATAQGDGG